MGTLDKILYIADYIEPRRFKAANLPQMRTLAFQDLDRTMYEILKSTLEYLKQKGASLIPHRRSLPIFRFSDQWRAEGKRRIQSESSKRACKNGLQRPER